MAKVADAAVQEGDLPGGVGRAVVHQDDFVVGIVQAEERLEAGLEGAFAVVGGNPVAGASGTRGITCRGRCAADQRLGVGE